MIKAIIFDLWNTLATKKLSITKTLMEHFNLEDSDDFIRRYEESVQLKKWDSRREMVISMLDKFNIPITDDNVNFISKVTKQRMGYAVLYDGIKELLEELHKKYKIAVLSNTNNFEHIKDEWGINGLVDAVVYSWEIGSLKPAKKNFEEACKKLGINFNECIFVDDFDKNVAAAESLGMKGIQFKNVEQLKEELLKN